MIFRRKKNAETEDPTLDEVTPEDNASEDADDVDELVESDDSQTDETQADDARAGETPTDASSAVELDVEALDAEDWRADGPYDISEVESDDDEDDLDDVEAADGGSNEEGQDGVRVDLGSVILTGIEEMELRLQMAEETQQLVSAMMIKDESALEVAAYAAPRSGGLWAELREEMVEQTTEAGGSHSLVAGPFGVELRRMLPVQMPNGEQGFQPSRMWVVEGQRWLLRGIVYGRAALEEGDEGPVEDLVAAFRSIVVRRGNEAKAPGDLLPLAIPEDLVRAQEEPDR